MEANRNDYYMKLLEGRAKRLNELIQVSAPQDMICEEVMLCLKAAVPLQPRLFKSWLSSGRKSEHEEYSYSGATG